MRIGRRESRIGRRRHGGDRRVRERQAAIAEALAGGADDISGLRRQRIARVYDLSFTIAMFERYVAAPLPPMARGSQFPGTPVTLWSDFSSLCARGEVGRVELVGSAAGRVTLARRGTLAVAAVAIAILLAWQPKWGRAANSRGRQDAGRRSRGHHALLESYQLQEVVRHLARQIDAHRFVVAGR